MTGKHEKRCHVTERLTHFAIGAGETSLAFTLVPILLSKAGTLDARVGVAFVLLQDFGFGVGVTLVVDLSPQKTKQKYQIQTNSE